MTVCAKQRNNTNDVTTCKDVNDYNYDHDVISLPPGGNVTIHFNQLVVADVITIGRDAFLALCEVDVLGTRVVLAPEGQFIGSFCAI